MTHGNETAQDGKEAETQEGFAFDLLWLWPVLLLRAIVEVFSGHAVKLKALRKAGRRIPEEDWLAHVETLRTSEWVIRAYLARQAGKLLAGEAIDLAETLVPAAPAGWRRPEPGSARELFLRFEAVNRMFASPMRHIARYARRIARAALAADPRHGAAAPASPAAGAEAPAISSIPPFLLSTTDPRWALGIRAPP